MAAVSSKLDGFTVHTLTTKKIGQFVEHFEEHMKWLEEVLVEAKNTFASKEIELLPKTPAVKRRRQKRKAAEVSSPEKTQSESEVENKGRRPKRNKGSAGNSSKRESATAQPLKEIQTETTTETDETDTAASVETAQPTVQVSKETSEDEKPKRTRGKRAPPRASKRTTKRTTRSMSTNKRAAEFTDDSSQEDESAASGSSENSRPKRGRKAKKKKVEETVKVIDSGVDTRSSLESTTNTGRSTRSTRSKATASKYVDHVKRLINKHEKLILDQSSDDDFQSPKRQKVEQGQAQEKNSSVLVPETPDKDAEEVDTPSKKFFPPVALEKEEKVASPKAAEEPKVDEEAVESENSAASPGVKETGNVQSDKTDTDDDSDMASVSTVEVQQEQKEPSPEKVAPLAKEEEDVESPQKEVVAEQEVLAEEEPQEPAQADEEEEKTASTDEDISDSMEEDSLDNVSVASSARSTRSRTSIQRSGRRSNAPCVLASKSKKKSSVMGRRSSVRQSMRTVTRTKRISRASTRRSSHFAMPPPPIMGNLEVEEEQHMIPIGEAPGSGSKTNSRSTTQTRRMTRSRIKQCSPSSDESELPNKRARTSDQFEDSLEMESRPPTTRESTRLKSKKASISSTTSSNKDDEYSPADKTPSPECPPNKVVRPHPSSFLNGLMKKSKPHTPTNLRGGGGVITSFIKRNTPQKKTLKEKQQEMKAQIQQKRMREEEIRKKVDSAKKNKIEEQKRKREERIRKVAEARQLRLQQQQQKRQAIEAKYEKKQVMSAQKQEEKRKEELVKRRQMTRKKAELDERRKQEEETRQRKLKEQEEEAKRQEELLMRKKEYEDSERLRRIEEGRRLQEDRRLEAERQRKEMQQRKLEMDLAREREQLQMKEDRDRERKELERKRFLEAEERERLIKTREEAEEARRNAAERALRDKQRQQEQQHLQEMMHQEKDRAEQERLKANILKHNTSLMNSSVNTSTTGVLNTTVTKESAQSPQSYQITPQRSHHKPSTDEDYGIDELQSDDSSDDEDAPRKKVPSWAQGSNLKAALINQYYRPPPNLDEIFPPIIEAPDLTLIFAKKKARFLKRTSSAHWNSPIWKPGMF